MNIKINTLTNTVLQNAADWKVNLLCQIVLAVLSWNKLHLADDKPVVLERCTHLDGKCLD